MASCQIRTHYCVVASGQRPSTLSKHALRNQAKATLVQEEKLLDKMLRDAGNGGVLVIPRLKPRIGTRLGKPLALSTVYRLLARYGKHGWRKLVPNTLHRTRRFGVARGLGGNWKQNRKPKRFSLV